MKSSDYEKELAFEKQIAKAVHKKQVDKSGIDYFEHVKIVGEAGETIKEKIIGYLHDVVEDSEISFVDLSDYGFPNDILNAIDAITCRKDESWRKYIQRVSENSIATKVKLNDLKHNSDLSRIGTPNKADLSRQKKYQKAIAILLAKQAAH